MLDGLLLRLILRIQNVFVKCILFTYIVCHSITASAVKSFSIIWMKVFKTKLQRNANKNFNHLFVFSRAVNTYYNKRELQAYSIWDQIQKVQVFDWKCRSLRSSFMNMPTKWIMLTLSWTYLPRTACERLTSLARLLLKKCQIGGVCGLDLVQWPQIRVMTRPMSNRSSHVFRKS